MEGLTLVYLACLLVGGVILLLSALGAFHIDVGDLGDEMGFIGIIGLRKIAFFTCFFGLTGLVMRLTAGPVATVIVASGMGVLCAWVGDAVIRRLAQQVATSGFELEEMAGLEAKVTVPFAGPGRGKILCEVQGRLVEMVAERASGGEQQDGMGVGDRVLICGIRDGIAIVEPLEG